MSSYVSLGGGQDPESIMEAALRLRAAGVDFESTAKSLADDIKRIDDQHPWGKDDDYAKAFTHNYVPFNDEVRKCLADAGTALADMGNLVVNVMAKYQNVDSDSSHQIKTTQPTE